MALDSYVRVAPDSTGKYIRNQSLYVPIDLLEGAGPIPTLVQQQVTLTADPLSGKLIDSDLKPLFSQLLEIQMEMRDALAMLAGSEMGVGTDNLPEPPWLLGVGGLPAQRAESYTPVRALGDRLGRHIVLPQGPREAIGTQATTISASTAETTI